MYNRGNFLTRLRNANTERVTAYGHGNLAEGWNLAEWGCALGGECGELLNILKKMHRQAPKDGPIDLLIPLAADEIADVLIYLDLIAAKLNIDLASAVAVKFNRDSDKIRSDVKL